MLYAELIAALAILQFLIFGALTGRARRLSGLKAPTMTGHPGFERMHRVQMNTLELLVAFLPSLLLAAQHWPTSLVCAVGAIYLLGRWVYWRAYVTAPDTRGLGFMLSMIPTVTLAIGTFVGPVWVLTHAAT